MFMAFILLALVKIRHKGIDAGDVDTGQSHSKALTV